jgi:hypothetical protein
MAGQPTAAALEAGDQQAWRHALAAAEAGRPPDDALIQGLFAIDPAYGSWERCATEGLPDHGLAERRRVLAWLGTALEPLRADLAPLDQLAWRFDVARHQPDAALEPLLEAIAAEAPAGPLHTRALLLAGFRASDDPARMARLAQTALDLAQELGDPHLLHHAWMLSAATAFHSGDARRGIALVEEHAPGPDFRSQLAFHRARPPVHGEVGLTVRHVRTDDERERAIADLTSRMLSGSSALGFARDATAVWAIGGAAEMHQLHGDDAVASVLWDAFDRWLAALREEGGPDAVQTVVQVAESRGYTVVLYRVRGGVDAPSEPPMVAAVRGWLEGLVREQALALAPGAEIDENLIDPVFDGLVDDGTPLGQRLSAVLLDAVAVEDLFADDATLEASLRRALPG